MSEEDSDYDDSWMDQFIVDEADSQGHGNVTHPPETAESGNTFFEELLSSWTLGPEDDTFYGDEVEKVDAVFPLNSVSDLWSSPLQPTTFNKAPLTTLCQMYSHFDPYFIELNRQSAFAVLLNLYSDCSDCSILNYTLFVQFDDEISEDFSGLTKELFTLFWSNAYERYFHGHNCKVPFLPDSITNHDASHFEALGRMFSHMSALIGSIPGSMARSVLIRLLLNQDPDDDCLIDDLLLFVSADKRRLLNRALSNFSQLTDDETEALIDFYIEHEMYDFPTSSDIRQQIVGIASRILLEKPEQLVKLMRNGIPESHIELCWSRFTRGSIMELIES